MQVLLLLGLLTPLFGFCILLLFSRLLSRKAASLIGCLAIALSFLSFVSLFSIYTYTEASPTTYILFPWIHFNSLHANVALHIDPLALLMVHIVTGIGLLIHIYSVGYMDHEQDVPRFFACMNFFIFSMLLLVLSAELLLLFVGWEGVGLASYLLIGFWYEKKEAAEAATKAFVVNRIGDLGLLLGLLLTFTLFQTTDIETISTSVGQQFAIGAPLITVLTLLYFVGATGKSAQIPLHTWLPDAMAGPTPVSALIHAATMVTAGVYLIVRLHSVFLMAPLTLQIIGVIGGITSLYASLSALGQTDLKRVLAYSTVSQLGLMFLACGAGAFYAAMFHLTTHAVIKAALFLSAGNVVHMMHGTTQMAQMGGLSKIFTKTHWFFLIAALALSGIPPLAAFFSKDLILENEFLSGYTTLYYIALAAAILTGVYLTRAYCLTFLGKSHLNAEQAQETKEAPPIMLTPVAILVLASIFGGFIGFWIGKTPLLESFIAHIGITPLEHELSTELELSLETFLALFGAFGGIIVTALIYTKYADRLSQPWEVFKHSFYIDRIYNTLFVIPLTAFASWLSYGVEPKVFEGSISFFSHGSQKIAQGLQHMQSGQIRSYVAWMTMGAFLLIVYFIF